MENFQWLAQEVQSADGEAHVMRVEHFEGLADAEIVARFQATQREDYNELDQRVTELMQSLRQDASSDTQATALAELKKIRRQHSEIRRVDFFGSPKGAALATRLVQLGQQLTREGEDEAAVEAVKLEAFKGKVWVTRPQPHVDRLACIWLIRRFIDAEATINYRNTAKPDEVSFDMTNARFGHVGNLCSFETMLRAFGLNSSALQAVAETVHELDLHDGRYARSETAGLKAVLEGWRQLALVDKDLEVHGCRLFDGLYTSLATSLATPEDADISPMTKGT